MELSLKNCPGCGRVYVAGGAMEACSECFWETERAVSAVEAAVEVDKRRSIQEIASHTRVPVKRVRAIVQGTRVLGRQLEPDAWCTRCRVNVAPAGSEYCVGCQLELYKALGDVAADVANGTPLPEPRRARPMHVRSTVHAKRRRTGSYRFTAVQPSIKGQ